MADLPTVHADLPIEELTLPPLATGWSQSQTFAPLRIFRQGKKVFFTGTLACGTNAGSEPFASPLPEGWRPAKPQMFPLVSPKGTCIFSVLANGTLSWEAGGWEIGRGSWFTLNAISYLAEN